MCRQDVPAVRRRKLIALLGVGPALALAGCGGGGDGGAEDGSGGSGTSTPTAEPADGDGTETASATAEPSDSQAMQAVDVPEDASCAVCEMKPAKFPDWNAQAAHADGTRAFFCTSGCATTYYAAPGEFAETDASIGGLWVTGFESGELVEGASAHYALETDSDRVDDPMRLNPAPFADREGAVAYVDAVDYLAAEDVVGLSAFDRELAARYRGRFLGE